MKFNAKEVMNWSLVTIALVLAARSVDEGKRLREADSRIERKEEELKAAIADALADRDTLRDQNVASIEDRAIMREQNRVSIEDRRDIRRMIDDLSARLAKLEGSR